ncbi:MULTISPECIES: STAS domain-containing protein [unclassified Streptomyces]|uniref:STAS domain-containing protein n=1 Tax=unclassified Streptomyces TaxID=2593676 RepID=UPI000DC768B6|nr:MULTISPECIES: STAS domain-containing protein [unclassified Streptomyces]AWZ05322.1 anti-anti-sigma factor [Streptomyces sp. ICC4]AWZ11430.1 anti-anti-sigma factor [Streptomyces sp. ICC1]
MTPLKITTRNSPAGPVMQIIGELDYTTAPDLRDVLAALPLEPGRLLVLDLARMEFCDSSGISALIAARNHVQAAQADIALAAVPAHTLRVLRIIGLDQVFRLLPGTGS